MVFFCTIESSKDFCWRVAPIGTAPVMFSLATLNALLKTGAELLNAFASLVAMEFTESKDHFIECGKSLLVSPIFVIAAILSPLVNLIDLIGSVINSSFREELDGPQFEQGIH